MRIVFLGTPEFAVPPLEHLILNNFPVAAVYTRPDKPAGRESAPVPSPVKAAALRLGLPVEQPHSLKTDEALARLAGFQPDVIVVAAFGQILPAAVLELPRYGCLNIHPSLLPRFRGASPVAAAILAGDEFTGVSIMLVDEAVDAGAVLAQAQLPAAAWDTTATLAARLSRVAAGMLPEVLSRWVAGRITPRPQDDALVTHSRRITKEDGRIDWRLPAETIWRRVRAFQPWPGCYTSWRGQRLEITEAVPVPGKAAGDAGRVVALDPTDELPVALGVQTGDGILGVLRLQMAGKRALSAAEFLRGQRQFIGSMLP